MIATTDKSMRSIELDDNNIQRSAIYQERVCIAVDFAISLVTYLINRCINFYWRCIHVIGCAKHIRLNRRAIVNMMSQLHIKEYEKTIEDNTFSVYDALNREKYFQLMSQSSDDRISLEILSTPMPGTPITADVVFIHGLHGSSDSTWKQGEWMTESQRHCKWVKIKRNDRNNNDSIASNLPSPSLSTNQLFNAVSQCWPKDWLPLDCPNIRVSAINYDTDPYLWRPVWYPKLKRSNLKARAYKMMEVLVEHRIGYQRPIVWVGHSKGGLYIKQIIVNAHESETESLAHLLWKSSKAILFYSVPHRGSPLADLNLPLLARSIEMIEIQKNFPSIIELHRRFVTMYKNGTLNMEVFSFVEMELTELSVFYLRIIGLDSADPGIGDVCKVPLDHLDVCKPRNRNCFLYRQLIEMINKAIKLSLETVALADRNGNDE